MNTTGRFTTGVERSLSAREKVSIQEEKRRVDAIAAKEQEAWQQQKDEFESNLAEYSTMLQKMDLVEKYRWYDEHLDPRCASLEKAPTLMTEEERRAEGDRAEKAAQKVKTEEILGPNRVVWNYETFCTVDRYFRANNLRATEANLKFVLDSLLSDGSIEFNVQGEHTFETVTPKQEPSPQKPMKVNEDAKPTFPKVQRGTAIGPDDELSSEEYAKKHGLKRYKGWLNPWLTPTMTL